MYKKGVGTMGNPIIEDYMDDLLRTYIVDEAMDLLNDGYPLDDVIKGKLQEVGIDPTRFIEIHQDKID